MAAFSDDLFKRMPKVRGSLTANAPLKDQTWFQVGGPAEVLFKPEDRDDLSDFLARLDDAVPLTLLGASSNTLIRDGGIEGVVIKLGPPFARIHVHTPYISAGAAALDRNIAMAAQRAALGGFAFMSGIPGTLGGALAMNAGAHGRETSDVVVDTTALDRRGNMIVRSKEQMGFAYRFSDSEGLIFIEATLQGIAADAEQIAKEMREIQETREGSQPVHERTAGSTFANPEGHKAWELIEAAGCSGLRLRGAMISKMHANFMINTGQATAQDLEDLGEEVRRRVFETSGIDLLWEIRRIGKPLS
ncbi:MAG: UDP-N-acetylmuramate dehydrogenase [Alphaproteobacteria bacterium]|nr:UDP-N-acetylmuramate dehydrogenase [Alphaproteobacteria bacterium]